jgi:chaperonin GroEL
MRFSNALILVSDYVIDSIDEMLPALEIAAREKKPFVIVSEGVEGQALAALILNAVRGSMQVAAIKAPRYGEERRNLLKDLAISVGATFISRESGKRVAEIKRQDLGSVKTIESLKNWTTFVGGAGNLETVEQQIHRLKQEILQTSDLVECERIQERITRLSAGVAIIRIGGSTEVDMIERKHRIEDALEAVKSAQQEGILPGGGIALLRLSQKMVSKVSVENEDERLGVQIIERACKEPLVQLAYNCGESADVILDTLLKSDDFWMGRDFYTGTYVDMEKVGIIDPAKVTRCAIQNSVSAASTLLTTSYAIIES